MARHGAPAPRGARDRGAQRRAGLVAALDAGGFDRHSFLCGQSGSGKTYSMGVILERLLLETSLRIVVLDPNSDYVKLPSSERAPGAPTPSASGPSPTRSRCDRPTRTRRPLRDPSSPARGGRPRRPAPARSRG